MKQAVVQFQLGIGSLKFRLKSDFQDFLREVKCDCSLTFFGGVHSEYRAIENIVGMRPAHYLAISSGLNPNFDYL